MARKKVNKKEIKNSLLSYLMLIVIFLCIFYALNAFNNEVHVLKYNEFMNELEKNEIKEMTVTTKGSAYTYEIKGTLKDYKKNETFFARLPLSDEVMAKIVEASDNSKMKITIKPDPSSSSLLLIFLFFGIIPPIDISILYHIYHYHFCQTLI